MAEQQRTRSSSLPTSLDPRAQLPANPRKAYKLRAINFTCSDQKRDKDAGAADEMHTQQAAKSAGYPALRFFAIAEMAEQIFLLLPISDLLLRIQRVNKLFHDTIVDSPRLQQALFLKPAGRVIRQHFDFRTQRAWYYVPSPSHLQPKTKSVMIRGRKKEIALIPKDQRPYEAKDVVLNPFLRQIVGRGFMTLPEVGQERFKKADASWRKMFVCQPPCDTMTIVRPGKKDTLPRDGSDGDSWSLWYTAKEPVGLKLGYGKDMFLNEFRDTQREQDRVAKPLYPLFSGMWKQAERAEDVVIPKVLPKSMPPKLNAAVTATVISPSANALRSVGYKHELDSETLSGDAW